MHRIVFYIAFVWLVALFCVAGVIIARSKSSGVRLLALDTMTLMLVALLIIYSESTGTTYYLDGAVVLSFISFIGTVAAARYNTERRIF